MQQANGAARNAAHLLTGLLEAERQLDGGSNGISTSPGHSRKRARLDETEDDDSEDGPFRQVVKRLLVRRLCTQLS